MCMRFIEAGLLALTLSACAIWNTPITPSLPPQAPTRHHKGIHAKHLSLLLHAEQQAHGTAKSLLNQAHTMALLKRDVIQGSCWDYLDALYTRAGFPPHSRYRVHTSPARDHTRYAHSDHIQAGDWLYYINHHYKNNEHSGLFIAWIDKPQKLGLVLSYAGEQRSEPARYRAYDLSSVYTIIRAK